MADPILIVPRAGAVARDRGRHLTIFLVIKRYHDDNAVEEAPAVEAPAVEAPTSTKKKALPAFALDFGNGA